MSLFQDKELVQKLMQIVQPQTKTAQTAPAIDPNMVKSIADKMILNLEKDTGISTDKSDAAAYMKDLQNLDSLVAFLKGENVHYSGKPIITENFSALDDADKKLYVPFKLESGFDAFPAGTTVGVYKDGLTGYLRSLNQEVSPENAGLINTLVGKLAQEANEKLKLGITNEQLNPSTKQSPPLADNAGLDTIYDTVVYESPLVPGRNQGNITITPKVLKSKAAFDDFLKNIKVKKQNKIIEYVDFTDETYCDILFVLHARAKSYAYRRGGELDKAYLQLITDLAGQYQCPIGDQAPSSSSGTPEIQQVSYKPGEGSGSFNKQEAHLAQSLAQEMPLDGDRIDLPRIVRWLTVFSKINKSATASAAINNAIQTAHYIMNTYRVDSQPLSEEASAIASNIITTVSGTVAQKSNAPLGYLQQLRKLISLIGTALGSYKNTYYVALPTEEMKTEVDNQIGAGGSSFYNINIDAVNTWIGDLPNALQQIRNQGF